MPADDRAASVYQFTLGPRAPIPIIRSWNRLEGRPRHADFQRSLRAEVRDPLWFLTRQWQYGEFEGEDAGSPIDARIAFETAALDFYEVGDHRLPYDPGTPLEVRLEREAVPFDLTMHMQAARVFERLLAARGHAARLADYVALFPLDYESGVAGVPSDETRALFDAGSPFLFDSARLIAAVRAGSHGAGIAGFPGLTTAERDDLVAAGTALVGWYERTYVQPGSEPSAWQPDRLEYRFACGAGAAKLIAGEHRGGDLDWHAFDVAASLTPAPAPAAGTALSFLPTAIRFGGMPSSRYWEMEDGKTDFGRLDVETNDLAKLLLAEFMLLYSNDWCVLPLELAVGSFTRIDGLLVTDVFGDQTFIRAAGRGVESTWQRWSMYRLEGDSFDRAGLLLAPTLTATVESPPLERVEFLRDEMANMVWAVEHRVASKLGEPFDPERAARAPSPTAPVTTAGARYTLGTTVPANWRPFVPAHVPGSIRSIRLQRARLPGQPQEPLGEILRVPAPYFIAEEEVPRAGRIVTRAFQRARWTNGATFLWIGRASPVGRGEGSSGLVFDQIDERRG
jgi:hypothetical protein